MLPCSFYVHGVKIVCRSFWILSLGVCVDRHLVPEFFAQKKLHKLSLASWQHFKHTGDNAVRALTVHMPSHYLGDPNSNIVLHDSGRVQPEDIATSRKPHHRHTRSEGGSLPDKKELSRNKLLQPLPDAAASNATGRSSIVDSRQQIGSVSMLRKKIQAVNALPEGHPSTRMPLPPQLRDAYKRQGRLLDGQLLSGGSDSGRKKTKMHRRGSSLPDHLVCSLALLSDPISLLLSEKSERWIASLSNYNSLFSCQMLMRACVRACLILFDGCPCGINSRVVL